MKLKQVLNKTLNVKQPETGGLFLIQVLSDIVSFQQKETSIFNNRFVHHLL